MSRVILVGTRLLIAISRGLAEVFGIMLIFILPFIGYSALMLHNAMVRVDGVRYMTDMYRGSVLVVFLTHFHAQCALFCFY